MKVRLAATLCASSLVAVALFHSQARVFASAEQRRSAEADRQTLVALENEWLNARDAATLERILAADFVHPVFTGDFLTKAQHIDWVVNHPPPANVKHRFDALNVRLYGDTGIATGIVVASDETGKEIDRTVFTDVFVYRAGRWQAVNAQETRVTDLRNPK